jgi:hypothetical protein
MSPGERSLQGRMAAAEARPADDGPPPPPLAPFGLQLHHDGVWSHEGQPVRNRKLRERFDRSVVYLKDEQKYVVRIGRFQGQIEVEEAGFFVRGIDLSAGDLQLSDWTHEALDASTLEVSPIDGALICRVKQGLATGGLPARFSHSAQAELLCAVEDTDRGAVLELAGERVLLPPI